MRKSVLETNSELNVHEEASKHRLAKIVCTIGPATQSVEALKELMGAGLNVARMNFSHGTHEYHMQTVNNIRQAAKEKDMHIAIALDTKGPEIRTGMFPDGDVTIEADSKVTITTDPAFQEKGTAKKFYCDYPNMVKILKPGSHIFIDDGVLDLVVDKINGKDLECTAQNAHKISSRRGVNLPMAEVDLPAVSEKDRTDLQFGAKIGVDMIFASFIRSASQIKEVRAALGDAKDRIKVIAKIENYQGVDNIDSIIQEADGIMVARGDLGVEIPAEKVVIAQKMIISKCNRVGKVAICATQMLESMTHSPRPTRAEVSDVANAVLDGADCVMLSGETAKGKYPSTTVEYMARIAREAEKSMRGSSVYSDSIKALQAIPMQPEEAVCAAAVNSAFELNAKAIVVLTNTGRSGRLISKFRPAVPILCASQHTEICRALGGITRGAIPVYYDTAKRGDDPDREKRVQLAVDYGKSHGFLKDGDLVVAVHADHLTKGFANQSRVLFVK